MPDALLHAARQLARIAILETRQPDQLDEVKRALSHLILVEALHVGRQHHVAEHAAPREQHGRLEHHADVAARTLDRRSLEVGLARSLGQQAGENLEQGGLTAPGRADDGDELTLADQETDVT